MTDTQSVPAAAVARATNPAWKTTEGVLSGIGVLVLQLVASGAIPAPDPSSTVPTTNIQAVAQLGVPLIVIGLAISRALTKRSLPALLTALAAASEESAPAPTKTPTVTITNSPQPMTPAQVVAALAQHAAIHGTSNTGGHVVAPAGDGAGDVVDPEAGPVADAPAGPAVPAAVPTPAPPVAPADPPEAPLGDDVPPLIGE